MKRISCFCFFLFLFQSASVLATEKEWTFLIYINGNNNLDPYGALNINSMENAPASSDVNVVVQWASFERETALRLKIQPDMSPEDVTSPVLEDLGQVDMGSHQTLLNFLKWGHDHFPAKKYFVVVWNHGTGWNREFGVFERDISHDNFTSNQITTEQLGHVMQNFSQYIGKKIEVYASDACLMASIDVADEMSDSVKYFGGSQELEPSLGWPYEAFLKKVMMKPAMDGGQALQILAREYLQAYSGGIYGNTPVTFSAYDFSVFSEMKSSMRDLGISLKQNWKKSSSQVLSAANSATWFFRRSNRDLIHFVKNLQNMETGISEVTVETVLERASRFLIANEVSENYPDAHGITIWFPLKSSEFYGSEQRYEKLKFSLNTGWHSFLSTIWGQK